MNPNWEAIFAAARKQAKECPQLCGDAESLVVFMKDIVNVKTGKPIHDKKNFSKWSIIVEAGMTKVGLYVVREPQRVMEVRDTVHP